MTSTCTPTPRRHPPGPWRCVAAALGLAASANAGALTGLAATAADDPRGRFCSATTSVLAESCELTAQRDGLRGRALCINLAAAVARTRCLNDTATQVIEGQALCRQQRAARAELCGALGEGRYVPGFAPAAFDTDFAHPTRPNPYYPLRPGNRWNYAEGDETIVVEVLDQTKLIKGVNCVVVHDRVELAGQPVEDTDDWYGQRKDGTVFYCGESVRNYQRFDGDTPATAELVDIDGSWKAGRDGDLPGIQFLATPAVGVTYRQEFSPNNAEDAARVLSVTYAYGHDAVLDAFVPADLARYLCSPADCVVTGEFTPLEPGVFQHKYYARGIGLFLEVNPDTGNVARLVDCNVDARCAGLAALRRK